MINEGVKSSKDAKAFILGGEDTSVENYVLDRVAQMSGLGRTDVKQEDLLRLLIASHTDDRYIENNLALYSKYVGFRIESPNAITKERIRLIIERIQRINQYADTFHNRETTANSYGTAAPSYIERLKEYDRDNHHERHKTLLMGALTVDGALEYNAVVKNTIPKASPYIIDLEGQETRTVPGFMLGDGLRLPFANDSFHSLHTNYLLHSLDFSMRWKTREYCAGSFSLRHIVFCNPADC
jgi:hypothetical protein